MNIRKVENTEKDCKLVFALSNDPSVRENSFNKEKIEYSNHLRWFGKAVSDINLLFFLVFDGDDFVGQIRFKRESEQAEECVISLSITEQFRGKRIALQFLDLGMQELKKTWPIIKNIVAEVKAENRASNKLFESAGFRRVEAGTVNIYKLNIN